MDQVQNRCSRCGSVVQGREVGGLCPSCLLALAVPGSLFSGQSGSTRLGDSSKELSNLRLTPGQDFGRYRIERLLGRGGMGEVYAAEQIEDGRRVALKVLSEGLADPRDRARFLREGQLAASVSHPNSVYVYGSEEIDGVPIITMELLSGGTLKDRVERDGPLPPTEAVEAILQVLSGLDAAHAAGILHRDVKPSNCFVGSDGAVKVGDFGLSISTLARDATQTTHAGFQGTPQFASPEQLRGEALDVRTDIYSVGATLFYLLTGSAPFEDPTLSTLVSRVKSEPPRSPRDCDRRIPRGLARIVLQCLNKDPESRPATHAALARQFQPFRQQPVEPAELGLRLAAGVIDAALLIQLLSAASLSAYLLWGDRSGSVWWGFWLLKRPDYLLSSFVYFAVLEGVWGASIGKWAVGLRVVRVSDNRPNGLRAAVRASVFCVPNVILLLSPTVGLVGSWYAGRDFGLWALQDDLESLLYLSVLAALSAGARRQNGFAALHDRISATRVVMRAVPAAVAEVSGDVPRVLVMPVPTFNRGPFEVRGAIGSTTSGDLLDGFDPVLRRRVWIHEVSPGTAAVQWAQSGASPAGRLRWLGGMRSDVQAWDAYEALDGSSLLDVLKTSVSWSQIKRWLSDLSAQLEAASDDARQLCMVGRVWITATGRARFLDFEIVGALPTRVFDRATALLQAQDFLSAIADAALRGPADLEWRGRLRLPVHARRLLDRLISHDFGSLSEISAECRKTATSSDSVTVQRRIAHAGLLVLPVACTAVSFALIGRIPYPRDPQADTKSDLRFFLITLKGGPKTFQALELPWKTWPAIVMDKADIDALEVYTLGRFGAALESQARMILWDDSQSIQAVIERARSHHPRITDLEFAAATARLKPLLERVKGIGTDAYYSPSRRNRFELWYSVFVTLDLSLIAALLSGLLVPGGIMLAALGMAIVRRDGTPISRAQSFVRTIVAWSPIVVLLLVHNGGPEREARTIDTFMSVFASWSLMPLAMLLMLAGACVAVINPQRGIQDRIAGTWLVPR